MRKRVPAHQRLEPAKPVLPAFPTTKQDMYAQNWDDPKAVMARESPDMSRRKVIDGGNPGIVKRGQS